MKAPALDPLDLPLYGAASIGRRIGIITHDEPTASEMRKAFHACKKLVAQGAVTKFGRSLTSTARRLDAVFSGK
jgi:hypothetical protein